MPIFKRLQRHLDAALADPTGPLTGEPAVAPKALPQRVKGSTLTPDYIDAGAPVPTAEDLADLDDLDEPVPYVPVGIDTYSCPADGCDYEIFAVGLQDPGEPDYFTEDIEQHKARHAVVTEWVIDADGEPVDVREVIEDGPLAPHDDEHGHAAPIASSSVAGIAALRFSHPAPVAPSLVELDQREALDSLIANAIAWANGPYDHKALAGALRLAVADYERVMER